MGMGFSAATGAARWFSRAGSESAAGDGKASAAQAAPHTIQQPARTNNHDTREHGELNDIKRSPVSFAGGRAAMMFGEPPAVS
jgi:hypothetical protein